MATVDPMARVVGGSPEEHFRVLFDRSPAAQCLVDTAGRFRAVNSGMCELLGRTEAELLELDVAAVTPVGERAAYLARLADLVAGRSPSITTHRSFVHADGHIVSVVITATLLRDEHGAPWRIVASAIDVTAQAEALAALQRSEHRFRALVENGFDLVAVVDRRGILRYLSPSVERALGPHPDWVVGRPALASVHPDDASRVRELFCSVVRDQSLRPSFEYRVCHAGEGWRYLRASATNVLALDDVGGIVFNAYDITEHRQAEEALRHQSTHDRLTGLLNREGFHAHLQDALVQDRRHEPVAVLSVDLDRFKLVNESYGYAAGDAVLVAAGERIRRHVRTGDVVARFGSDEFLVCCPGCGSDEAAVVAQRVGEAFREPIDVAGERVYVTVSIGIARSDAGEDGTPEGLLRDVAAALDRAKERGRSRYEVFDGAIRDRARAWLETESGLREALVRDELEMWYQPQVDLRTGALTGAEGLMRWAHPTRGLLLPGDFIPVAESSDLICDVGSWALRQVCLDLARVPGEVSVNLSARELDDEHLVERIEATLHETGADPGRLWIEITETVLMADAARHAEVLSQLRALGLRVAVDDFGTGYSSLAYLRRFPVDYLKIDRSFVDGVGIDPEDTAVAEAIIGLAHTLGMRVVAEGIELVDQRDTLAELGCDIGQGFLFGHPVPAAELGRTLATV